LLKPQFKKKKKQKKRKNKKKKATQTKRIGIGNFIMDAVLKKREKHQSITFHHQILYR
jgi:hypothetical protein